MNYRSSTIFPFFIGEHEDTVLVFQNYWKWKSSISNVIANLFIRDCDGKLILSDSIEIKTHNEISIKKFFNKDLNSFNSNRTEIKKIFNGVNEIFEDIDTKVNKKVIDINVGNETFEKIDQCFDNIYSNLAKKYNLKLIVDNTFSPLSISPAQLGADIVIHSLTKFINGSSDSMGGVVCGTLEFVNSFSG